MICLDMYSVSQRDFLSIDIIVMGGGEKKVMTACDIN